MIHIIDISECKKKFATLIAKLYYSAGIGLDQINIAFVRDNKFTYFEDNNAHVFIEKTYDELADELFNAQLKYDTIDDGPVYWAALQIATISFNYNIPISQIMLLCPLKEMAAHFGIYHEMGKEAICNEFFQNEYKRSILKELRELCRYKREELARLSGISRETIKYFESDNKNLFNASHEKIERIMRVLKIESNSLWYKTARFAPVTEFLFEDTAFLSKLKTNIKDYFLLDANVDFDVILGQTNKRSSNYLSIAFNNTLNIGSMGIIIDDDIMLCLIKNAIDYALERNHDRLYF